ncbi:MAG: hypothetical protein ACOYIP_08000 [Coriobacteriales bacterium]
MADGLDNNMDEIDREIAARLRSSLDGIEPDEAASARMLTALKDAEALRSVRAGASRNDEAMPAAAAVSPAEARPKPRMRAWKVAAPIAAVLVVAAIGFGVYGQSGPKAGLEESAANVSAESASEETYAGTAEDELAAPMDSAAEDGLAATAGSAEMADMATEDKAASAGSPADEFGFVTLDDGTELTVEPNQYADDALIGKLVTSTEAFDDAQSGSIPCKVYEYDSSDEEAYAVVFEGDPSGEAHLAHPSE